MPSPDTSSQPHDAFRWFLRGALYCASVPALILYTSFVGFAALAMQAGVTQTQAVFMTLIVWALPAKVVLVGAIIAGNSLVAAAFAVALSSVRLTPMVVALTPELRTEKTRRWVLYLLSHFVAVTSWVIAMEHVKSIPRPMRTAWYGGVGATLVVANAVVVWLVYQFAQHLPPAVSAALFLLTPMYFLTSLWGSARERAGHVAMVLGLVLWPVFDRVVPEFALLATGFLGGAGAFGWHLLSGRRA